MTEKSEALRLADALRDSVETDGEWSQEQVVAAAAELRRLHAENERVFKLADDQDSVIRRQRTERQTLEAQRDALLEALRPFAAINASVGFTYKDVDRARAAVKAVEENT